MVDRSLALLSSDVYGERGEAVDGWSPVTDEGLRALGIAPSLMTDDKSGFHAGLYVHDDYGHALAFRGTDEVKDWLTNSRQPLGLDARQYRQAVDLAAEVSDALGDRPLVITGHSLGGGLATTVSLRLDVPAVTFNSAGVHDLTLRRFEIPVESRELAARTGHIRRYTVDNEILTALQEDSLQTRMLLPDAIGHHIRLRDPEPLSILERALPNRYLGRALEAHSMDTVLRALDFPHPLSERSQLAEALIAQSIRGIQKLEDLRQVAPLPAQGLLNAAVFVATRARESGMTRVDHVACSGRGDRLFVIQGSPMDPAQRRIAVDVDAAASEPVHRNAAAARQVQPDASAPPLVPRFDWQQAHHVLGGH